MEKYLTQDLKSYSTFPANSSQYVVRMMVAGTGPQFRSQSLAPEAYLHA